MTNCAISVQISPGELLDRISILEIKCERLPQTLSVSITKELRQLRIIRETKLDQRLDVQALYDELKSVNESLWDIEDAIRRCEAQKQFGARFIELARSVYRNNDKRSSIKSEIDRLFQSSLAEVKFYPEY